MSDFFKKLTSYRPFFASISLILALIISLLLKYWLLALDALPFNSDEAVVALMARHIRQGQFPIFFYGQAYMGSLDAWLVALGFSIFGEQVWVIRLVQALLYLGVIYTTAILGQAALGSKRAGLIAAWLLAVPNVIVTLYTTVSLGGYVEALLIGNLILILGLKIARNHQTGQPYPVFWLLAWGFLAGLGLWVFGLTLVFSIPMGIFLLVRFLIPFAAEPAPWRQSRFWKNLGWMSLGGLIGATPWWIFALQNGFTELLKELGGSAVDVETAHWLYRVGRHLSNLILFGGTAAFGMRPSWEIRWLGLPLLPFVLAFWVAVLGFILGRFQKGKPNRFGAGVLVGSMLVLSAGFIFTPFGVDPSGRYFVPLVIPLALFAGEMILQFVQQYGKWGWGLLGLVLVYQFWGIAQTARVYPPGITTQFNQITQVDQRYLDELIQFLQAAGETTGYTNYWVSYPLAFESQERLIFVPRLPYHEDFRYTARDDRYQPYADQVTAAQKVAYITTHHPRLNEFLREQFRASGIDWREKMIGDYFIFYDLSDLIRPADLDWGLAAP